MTEACRSELLPHISSGKRFVRPSVHARHGTPAAVAASTHRIHASLWSKVSPKKVVAGNRARARTEQTPSHAERKRSAQAHPSPFAKPARKGQVRMVSEIGTQQCSFSPQSLKSIPTVQAARGKQQRHGKLRAQPHQRRSSGDDEHGTDIDVL